MVIFRVALFFDITVQRRWSNKAARDPYCIERDIIPRNYLRIFPHLIETKAESDNFNGRS